ncbi:MAG TPA: hypothetical protein VMD74_04900 [Candidatus Methylomirabilis sp.]|nr:hypothetical protein [Candidatus Methylomirabilis sp.]
MRKINLAVAIMIVALLGVMSSQVFAGAFSDFFKKSDDASEKYRQLENIITEDMKEQSNQKSSDAVEFNWEFIEFKKIPDCNGQVHTDYTLRGLFFPAGGKDNVFRVANKDSYAEDGYINVQVCVLTYLRNVVGGTIKEKHYRVYTWQYELNSKEWSQTGVKAHITTWPCQKKLIKDVDWTYEDVCGSCGGAGDGWSNFWKQLFGN